MGTVINQNDILYECILKYNQLLNKSYMYKLYGGINFELRFQKHEFPHLIGLQYLTDINMFNKLNNKNLKGVAEKIYRQILNKQITYSDVCNSTNFSKIEDRIKYFLYIEDVVFSEIIINFDKSKLKSNNGDIGSTLKSNMILYDKKGKYYLHLCIYNKKGETYAESFFARTDRYYIKDQNKREVTSIDIFDTKTKENKGYIVRNGILTEKK